MKVPGREGNGPDPSGYGHGEVGEDPLADSGHDPAPPRNEVGRKEWVDGDQALEALVHLGHQEPDGGNHGKRELESGLKQLGWVPREHSKGSGGQRVQDINRPAANPTGNDDGRHHPGSDRRRLPARGGDVEPDRRQGDQTRQETRDQEQAQCLDEHIGDQGDVQTTDGEDVHRAGSEKGFLDFVDHRGFPAEGHGPEETKRVIFLGQSTGQRGASPVLKSIGPGRSGSILRFEQPPIGGSRGPKLPMNAPIREVGSIVEESGGQGRGRPAQDSRHRDASACKKGHVRLTGRRDQDRASDGDPAPVRVLDLMGVENRVRVGGAARGNAVEAKLGCLAERSVQGDQVIGFRGGFAQVRG